MPKISIIIPIYNVEEYIRQALDSVVNQTLKDIEIICVNDCTPDKSFEIVKEYASKDSRFVLLEQETNQGQGVARNRALDIATGDYIMFLDPDDWFEPDACEKAYNRIDKNKNEMVFFNFYIQKEKKGKIVSKKISPRLDKFEKIKENQHIDLAQFKENWLTTSFTWVQIYSRDFLLKNDIKFSQDRFNEDVFFFIKAVLCSEDISILDSPIYNARRKIGKMVINYYDFYNDVYNAKDKARNLVKNSIKKDCYWDNYLIYETRTILLNLNSFWKRNKKARKELYPKIRKRFIENSQELPKGVLEGTDFYKRFKAVTDSKTYWEFRLRKVFYSIFK